LRKILKPRPTGGAVGLEGIKTLPTTKNRGKTLG
jgi:hypothetical protein